MSLLEKHFKRFRKNTIGIDKKFESPFGMKKQIYGDWIASGRLYRPIEKRIQEEIGSYIGNTHSETSETGALMTNAYQLSHQIIKQHCNADPNDIIITAGFGMTTVINKFQRILGLKLCGKVLAT